MTREEGENAEESIAGLPIEEAVEAVLTREEAAGDAPDPEAVRAALDQVTEDGVVRWDAADEALAHASKVVSTPETRVELATIELEDARGAAEPVADVPAVQYRLANLEDRLSALEDAVDELAGSLQAVARRSEAREDLYAVARGLRDVTAEANRLHGAAEDLKLDVEAFERWLGSHGVRVRELEGDVDALERSLDELADAVDAIARAGGSEMDGAGEPADGRTGDPAARWVDASLRRRVRRLLLADLRAELDDLGAMADPGAVEGPGRTAAIEARLDDLDAGLASIGDRLEEIAEAEWRSRFGDRLESFESATEAFDPPIDWGTVATLREEHRVEGSATGRSGPGESA